MSWNNDSKPEFTPVKFVDDGQDVWFRRYEKSFLRCKVACVAGYTARIVSEEYKINMWVSINNLYVPTEEVVRSIMES